MRDVGEGFMPSRDLRAMYRARAGVALKLAWGQWLKARLGWNRRPPRGGLRVVKAGPSGRRGGFDPSPLHVSGPVFPDPALVLSRFW